MSWYWFCMKCCYFRSYHCSVLCCVVSCRVVLLCYVMLCYVYFVAVVWISILYELFIHQLYIYHLCICFLYNMSGFFVHPCAVFYKRVCMKYVRPHCILSHMLEDFMVILKVRSLNVSLRLCSWTLHVKLLSAEHLWWYISIGSDNGLVLPGTKPLPEPMLTQIFVANMTLSFRRFFIWHSAIQKFVPSFIEANKIEQPALVAFWEGNPAVTSGFPTQRDNSTERVSMACGSCHDAGPRLNIKTVLSTYGDFHVKDKTAVRTSYL